MTHLLAALTGQDYAVIGRPPIAWGDHAARDALVSALVDDALALLAVLEPDAVRPSRWRRGIGTWPGISSGLMET